MPRALWLDDMRDPASRMFKDFLESKLDYLGAPDCEVVWVKNYGDFVETFSESPDFIAVFFDHDLGEKKSGYDAACFVERGFYEGRWEMPFFFSQSANPVGKRRILSIWDAYESFKNRNAGS
jgi:hypothetical protein